MKRQPKTENNRIGVQHYRRKKQRQIIVGGWTITQIGNNNVNSRSDCNAMREEIQH